MARWTNRFGDKKGVFPRPKKPSVSVVPSGRALVPSTRESGEKCAYGNIGPRGTSVVNWQAFQNASRLRSRKLNWGG